MSAALTSHEPATGALLWQGESGDVDDIVARARSGWPRWAAQPVAFRIETLRRFVNVVRAHEEELADLIARETGKPLWDARTEVTAVMAKIDTSVAAYSERTGQRRLEANLGARQSVRHKPHGVMAVLGPYNFPAHLPNGHIIPALLAGNAVIFKPSEKTPAVGEMLVRFYHEAGVPTDAVQLLLGGAEEGKALAAHADVAGILFTGSAQTGIAINRQFATQPGKILALEMGGNNPLVVWDTPEIGAAAALVIQSAFLSSGQRCTAASRLIVRDAMADALIAEVKKLADRLIVDHPHADPQPYMGPVIDNPTADGLTESFLYLMSHGGRPIKHMVRPQKGLPFLTPAIIDVTAMKERPDVELFGPLLQIVRVPDFETAIAEANSSRYGLSASLVGGSPEQYAQFWGNVRAGVINWNRPTNGASGTAPFGGVGVSGNHRPSAYYAADYCAYPVASAEIEQPRATIGIGLKDIDVSAMGD
ncbi:MULTISPECIES: succinylglutamate-semialdehyde dehydrogenase [Sphingobium]|uniref:Succinylglutamic semialdehyde dehydrogenase n=2 Tax=Sphingobium yanoikuyae TaxID=13690 RepID=K9CM38_SPHYA|nr:MULTISPECIES: succinylglutamate-semialdehyde dehydrogenase [Sphingobium]AYO77658.1 succinylglutamate-semialdehyde dehydrogenase [Sphingobium yanoikuyae]EKU72948.1 succinylglutamic semialdehyde dehydrogenase [Sphingobium yanoikuyae ATCC 51230]KFD28610.1 succinylglutamate-semialdehyde dehydrogenase [Sphingobium yanoikuyae]KZC81825.1 N-succinylglutamate 5-semialdehyde dehydrogenase [Sphingobium yanoikuyae]MDV3479484.1 succinylglutamate-semialdehyde dehydrogenase [Sphingobium yanoikuyae]